MQQSINLTAGMNTLGIQLVPTAPTPPPPAATASLTVTVTDSVTGQPVSGAQVSIAGMALNTNSVGQCIFTGIPVGQYEITVTMAGYLLMQETVVLTAGDNTYNAQLTPSRLAGFQVGDYVWYPADQYGHPAVGVCLIIGTYQVGTYTYYNAVVVVGGNTTPGPDNQITFSSGTVSQIGIVLATQDQIASSGALGPTTLTVQYLSAQQVDAHTVFPAYQSGRYSAYVLTVNNLNPTSVTRVFEIWYRLEPGWPDEDSGSVGTFTFPPGKSTINILAPPIGLPATYWCVDDQGVKTPEA
jgi:hypothetical protein